MSMFKAFKTNESREMEGIKLDYGTFRVHIRRAGGANKKFAKTLERKTKPLRRVIENEQLPDNVADRVMIESYAESVVIGWETQVDGEFQSNVIEAEDGSTMEYSTENVIKTFEALPELFADVRSQADKYGLFTDKDREEDSKN